MSVILITGPDTYTGDTLKVGRYYSAEEYENATERQNRAYWALLQELFRTGMHSYNVKDIQELHQCIKRDYGSGFWKKDFVVRDESGVIGTVKVDVLKSLSDYTKKEKRLLIDGLIAFMIQTEVKTRHFYEILEGMEANSEKVR